MTGTPPAGQVAIEVETLLSQLDSAIAGINDTVVTGTHRLEGEQPAVGTR